VAITAITVEVDNAITAITVEVDNAISVDFPRYIVVMYLYVGTYLGSPGNLSGQIGRRQCHHIRKVRAKTIQKVVSMDMNGHPFPPGDI
jgi:hypothetical protein